MKRLVGLLVGLLAIVVVPEFVPSVVTAGYPDDPPVVLVTPSSPFVGDPVTFDASNFAPLSTVDFVVTQPGVMAVVTTLTADMLGNASLSGTASLMAGGASVQVSSFSPSLATITNYTIQALPGTTTTTAATTTTIAATTTTAAATTTTAGATTTIAATTTTAAATTTTAGAATTIAATTSTAAAASTTIAATTTIASATTTIAAATTTTVAAPAVTPSNSTPLPGTDITIKAAGFIPGSTVIFEITGDFGPPPANANLRPQVDSTQNLGSAVADASGVATKVFKAPERPGGYTVKATSGERSATTFITVALAPAATTAVSAVPPNAPAGGLPSTGTETTTWLRVTVLLLVVGAGFVVVGATRRKPRVADR